MNKDEFTNILIPLIDHSKQAQIAELVQESFMLKAESQRLLHIAKQAVEIAIETDEATAIQFINDHTK
jgi:type I restriction enzyme S subunit/type I restriction enzyme M protein